MPAAVVRRTDTSFVVQVEVHYRDSMLEAEDAILDALNEAGVAATEEALRRFDADGRPIRLGPMKLTSMGKVRKEYQTPYGVAAAAAVLSLRCLTYTAGRWDQFWSRIDRSGFPIAA